MSSAKPCSGPTPRPIPTKNPSPTRAGGGGFFVVAGGGEGEREGRGQRGGGGASWVGEAPFVKPPHVFQNIGDGTYYHSGLLAVRAAAASGVNVTYKILYNEAAAVT